MVRIEQLAEAAINQDALLLRSLTQDLLRERPSLKDLARPVAVDFETLAAAASLIELLACVDDKSRRRGRMRSALARTNSFGESSCNDEALAGIVRATSSRIAEKTRVLRTT